ncbi:porin family protein [Hyphococcus formosus]|uniref:surface lipoprotein assembly modifier n=1 Tax=Hyphococcus formosus TaxID=3143534 RepID=UPI00398B8EF6
MAALRGNVTASLIAFASLCVVATGFANAQEPEESAREAADRTLTESLEREDTRRDYSGGTISFEQVLAAPDDVRLNIAYARDQIAAGDLKEASATLERVLLLEPQLYDVRVLYGFVLYRLGLFDRARYELELAIASGTLTPTMRAEAETYLSRIKYHQRTTRGTFTLTTGIEWDHNRNQSPSSGIILFQDIPFDANPRVSDVAHVLSLQGRLVHDLGSQEGHVLHADAGYYRSDKFEFDSLDLDAVSLALGGTWYAGNWSITPRARGGFFWLDGNDYLRTLGGELEVAYRFNPRMKSFAAIRVEDEDFRATPGFASAVERSGTRWTTRGGIVWRLSPTQTITVAGLYSNKDAARTYEAYDRYGVNAQHSWLLGRGAFTQIGAWAERSDYEANDPFVSANVREEWLYRGRATIGAPLSLFFPGAPDGVKSINLIAQYEYETVDSNIANYDYDTHKISFLLSRRFAF